jgi:DNA-binding transcriptional ArsR family regulator
MSEAQGVTRPADPRIRRAAGWLKHVSDVTALRVFLTLAEGERHVGGLSDGLGLNLPAVSNHLIRMRGAGLVESRREGRRWVYRLTETGRRLAAVAGRLMDMTT